MLVPSASKSANVTRSVLDALPRSAMPHTDRANTRSGAHQYSLVRAIRQTLDQRQLDGLEREVHQELSRRRAGANLPGPAGGFLAPLDMRVPGEARAALDTSTGSGALATITHRPWLEAIRQASGVDALGATMLSGLVGSAKFPVVTAGAVAEFTTEGTDPTESSPEIGSRVLAPRQIAATVITTRKFLLYTGPAGEDQIMIDLTDAMANALDTAAVNGSGTGEEPEGLVQNSSIPTIALGTDGAAPTHAAIVEMERRVLEAGGARRRGRPAYLTSPRGQEKLKTTPMVAGQSVYLWEALTATVNGWPGAISGAVPSNLTKGSGTNLTALLFGDWTDLVVAQWGDGVEILPNPYVHRGSKILITAFLNADVAPRRPAEKWVKITDMTTS